MAHSNIQKAERFMYYLIPDCIFIVHVQKKKTCLYPPSLIFLWLKLKHAVNKHDCTVFDLCGQRRTFILFFLEWFICFPLQPLPSNFCDWLITAKYLRLGFAFGVVKIALGGKTQSRLHSSSFAEALICFNVALHIFPSVHLRPKALSIKAVHLNLLPSYKSLITHQIYCLSQ